MYILINNRSNYRSMYNTLKIRNNRQKIKFIELNKILEDYA